MRLASMFPTDGRIGFPLHCLHAQNRIQTVFSVSMEGLFSGKLLTGGYYTFQNRSSLIVKRLQTLRQ